MEKGTTIGAKVSNYYNQLIDRYKLQYKYNKISVGDKIRYIYVEPTNIFGIDAIGWSIDDGFPDEFKDIFDINYYLMFEKSVIKKLEKFMDINGWGKFHPQKKVLFDISQL